MKFVKYVAFLAILFLGAVPAFGQEWTSGSRAQGMGDAYTAVGTGSDGMYHNPAGIAHEVMYEVAGRYGYAPSGNSLNATIVDSKTNPSLSAGVSYSYFIGQDEAEGLNGHDIRAALAIPAVPERVSIGIGGRWIITKRDGVEEVNHPTLDAGVLFKVADLVRVGFVGQNLVQVCKKPEVCKGIAPATVSGGASLGDPGKYSLNAEVEGNLSEKSQAKLGTDIGGEYYIADSFPVRLGYQFRQIRAFHFLTTGVGWRSSKASVNVAYKANLTKTENFHISGMISMKF